jgi:exonuclease III
MKALLLRSGKPYLKLAKKNRKVKGLFSKFGFLIYLGVVALLLLSYLAPYVPPDRFWPLAFLGLGFPILFFVNGAFLIIWVLLRSKKLLFPLFIFLLGFHHVSNTFQIFPKSGIKQKGVEVLSYNAHHFGYDLVGKGKTNHRIPDYLKSTHSEILCIQEGRMTESGKLSLQGIMEALPGIKYYHQGSNALITFSKYPILNKGEIRFSGSSNLFIYSDIKINNQMTIRVYNCHLQSYSIDPEDYNITDPSEFEADKQEIERARKITFKLKSGFIHRASQARKLADHIGKSPFPVIVCGDFNDTPVSFTYRKVRGDLKDAFVESGWGVSNTYNGKLPSFRIDYIFTDKKFTPVNYKRDKVNFSDHYPIHCQVNLK